MTLWKGHIHLLSFHIFETTEQSSIKFNTEVYTKSCGVSY